MFDKQYSTTRDRAAAIFEGLSNIQRDTNAIVAIAIGDDALGAIMPSIGRVASDIQDSIQALLRTMSPNPQDMASLRKGPGRPRKEPIAPAIGPDGAPVRRGPGRPSRAELEARAATATVDMKADGAERVLAPIVSEAVREAMETVGAATPAKQGRASRKPPAKMKASSKRK